MSDPLLMTARENELAEKLEARALGLARGLTSAPGESTGDLLRLAASTLRANAERIKALEEALDAAHCIVFTAPELNLNAYTEDQVAELNNAMIECFVLLDAEAKARAARSNPHV